MSAEDFVEEHLVDKTSDEVRDIHLCIIECADMKEIKEREQIGIVQELDYCVCYYMLYIVYLSYHIVLVISLSFQILDDEERKQQVIDGKFWGLF